jgi:hypothetical protein
VSSTVGHLLAILQEQPVDTPGLQTRALDLQLDLTDNLSHFLAELRTIVDSTYERRTDTSNLTCTV